MSIDLRAFMGAKTDGDMSAMINRALDDASQDEIDAIMSAFTGTKVTGGQPQVCQDAAHNDGR